MTKQEANQLIADKIAASRKLLEEAAQIADAHDLEFTVESMADSVQDTYYRPGDWNSSACEWETSEARGWHSSSDLC